MRGYPNSTLKFLPLRERPDYRIGIDPENCSLVELFALIIGGTQQMDIASALVGRYPNMRSLQQAQIEDLTEVEGIGPQTAGRIRAALALGRRLLAPDEERVYIHSPGEAAALVQYQMGILEQEVMKVILLNTRNQLMGIVDVYQGSLNSAQVRIGEVFKPAVQRQAASIIVVHNHPSADPSPSPDDVVVTRALVQAGNLLDITVIDHIIIGGTEGWVSLKERGLGF